MRYRFEGNDKKIFYHASLRYHRGVYEGRVENYAGVNKMNSNRRKFQEVILTL